jgi:hypothetical protein
MDANFPPPAGAPTLVRRCEGECGRETLHYGFTADRNDELRGGVRMPVDRYEVCTVCGTTTDVTRG